MNFILRSLLRKQDDFSEIVFVLPRWRACNSPLPYFLTQILLSLTIRIGQTDQGLYQIFVGEKFPSVFRSEQQVPINH